MNKEELLKALVKEVRDPQGIMPFLLETFDFLNNGYRLVEAYAEIPLTQGLVAKVSVEDLPYVLQHKWYAAKNTGSEASPLIYPRAKIQGKTIVLSRFLLKINADLKDSEVGDHKNHDTLDNQRGNLRVVTATQSAINRRLWKNKNPITASSYKGVHRNRPKNDGTVMWSSSITIQGKQTHLGTYEDETEAAKRYDVEAKKYHGEYANLNFPEG